MVSNPAVLVETIHTQLKELIQKAQTGSGGSTDSLNRDLDRILDPLGVISGQLTEQTQENETLRQDNEHLRAAGEVLRAENERLRARLAEQREVETVVSEQAETFRALAENSPDLVMRLDKNLCHLYVNPALVQLAQMPREAFLQKSALEMDIYRPLHANMRGWLAALEAGEEVWGEIPFPVDGVQRWFDLRIVPERGGDGQFATILVLARDITEHKANEQALLRSEQRFQIATAQAKLIIFEHDLNLMYTWVHDPDHPDDAHNPLLGKHDEDLFPPESASLLVGLKREVLRTGKSLHREVQVVDRGLDRWYEVMFEPARDAEGRITGILASTIDITGRKRVERELAYRSQVLENVHDAIIATDANLAITSWNRAAEALYGWKADEVLGRNLHEIIPSDFTEPLRVEKSFQAELAQYRRDGHPLWVESHGIPLMDEDGRVTGFVNANRDVSERHRLEEANERQRQLMEAIFEANPGGIAVVSGPEAIFRVANAAYRSILPQPDLEIIGRAIDEIWTPADGLSALEMIRPVLEEQASLTLEHVTRRYSDGRQHSFTIHARPIEWEGQAGALLVIWETTELEEALLAAEAAAEEAHRRAAEAEEGRRMLNALMEYIPEGVTITSVGEMRLLHISKFTAGMVGASREALEGLPLRDYLKYWYLLHQDGKTPLKLEEYASVRAALNGEVIQDQELILRRKDQSQIHLLINAGPIRDADGRIFASVVAAHDITERIRGEANQRFLSQLARDLVPLLSSEAVLAEVAQRLGEYLDVDRCFISEETRDQRGNAIRADYHKDLPGIAGIFELNSPAPRVTQRLSHGRPCIVANLASDPLTADAYTRLFEPVGIRAMAAVPMFDREGRWAETLVIATRQPRVWQPEEIGLLNGVADLAHLALESARLFTNLQEFRYRFDLALRNAPITVFATDRDLRATWIYNPRRWFEGKPVLGRLPGELALDEDNPLIQMERAVLESGVGSRRELKIQEGDEITSHDVTVEPLRDARDEIVGLTVAMMENTELRRIEAEALRSQARIEVQRRLIAEREMERTRIARELHDGPLQELIATSYNLVEAMDINEKTPRLTKMRVIQSMLQKQIQELRRFCNDLRPPVLAPFGLEKTVRSHVEGLQELYPDLTIFLNLEHDGQRLPEEIRMTFFRIYQELMNNVIRHARASEVTVYFRMEKNQAVLEMEDNGVGFDAPPSWIEYARKGHLGLVGVQERVEMVGGQMAVETQPGAGTRVRVLLPLP